MNENMDIATRLRERARKNREQRQREQDTGCGGVRYFIGSREVSSEESEEYPRLQPYIATASGRYVRELAEISTTQSLLLENKHDTRQEDWDELEAKKDSLDAVILKEVRHIYAREKAGRAAQEASDIVAAAEARLALEALLKVETVIDQLPHGTHYSELKQHSRSFFAEMKSVIELIRSLEGSELIRSLEGSELIRSLEESKK